MNSKLALRQWAITLAANLLDGFSDDEGETLTVDDSTSPIAVTLSYTDADSVVQTAVVNVTLNANGTYSIAANDLDELPKDALATGSFQYTVTDSASENAVTTHTAKITITGTNDVAVLSTGESNITVSNSLPVPSFVSGTLTSNDVDNIDNLFTESSETGTLGTLVMASDGTYTFTPAASTRFLSLNTIFTEDFTVTSIDGTSTTVTIKLDRQENTDVTQVDTDSTATTANREVIQTIVNVNLDGTADATFNAVRITEVIQRVASSEFVEVFTNSDIFVDVRVTGDFLRSIERHILASTAVNPEVASPENGGALDLESSFYDVDSLTPEQMKFIETLLESTENFELDQQVETSEGQATTFEMPSFDFITELEGQAIVEVLPEAMTMDQLDERKSLDETLNGEFSIFS